MEVKTHVNIWKILLNFNKIKKKFNYQKIKEEMKNNPNDIPAKEIILLDVARTSFTENKEENREKIANILKAISKESPNITYCQGMNYIASFLLMITNDEEETFDFIVADDGRFLCLRPAVDARCYLQEGNIEERNDVLYPS